MVTTAIFLETLYTDFVLATYAVVGLAVAVGGLWLLAHHRSRWLDMAPIDPHRSYVRGHVEVGADHRAQWEEAAT